MDTKDTLIGAGASFGGAFLGVACFFLMRHLYQGGCSGGTRVKAVQKPKKPKKEKKPKKGSKAENDMSVTDIEAPAAWQVGGMGEVKQLSTLSFGTDTKSMESALTTKKLRITMNKEKIMNAARSSGQMQVRSLRAAAMALSGLKAKPAVPVVRSAKVRDAPVTKVSSHVLVDGDKAGVVSYRGPTLFGDGVWLGITMNNMGKGDNDGEIKNVRYFKCRPGHGLFIREDSLRAVRVNPEAANSVREKEDALSAAEKALQAAGMIVGFSGRARLGRSAGLKASPRAANGASPRASPGRNANLSSVRIAQGWGSRSKMGGGSSQVY